MDNYTLLDLGLDYLPYWDEPIDSDIETETSTETTDINNFELPF